MAAAMAARPGGYTAVHTVLAVNSASVAMMSVGWMLRSYIGFSNVARTFVFSWPVAIERNFGSSPGSEVER